MNKRIMYIDIYKALLMILVIIGHLHFYDYNSKTLVLIYSFHMPTFLILAGYLSNITEKTNIIQIINKRFKSTIIPYFIFSFISLVIIPKNTDIEQKIAIVTIFRGIGDPVNSINLPLWFLTFFFIAMTTFEILDLLSIKIVSFLKNIRGIILLRNIILLLFCSIFMYLAYIYARVYKLERLPFNIEISLFSLLYIYIGKLIRQIRDTISNTFIKKSTIILIIFITMFIYIFLIIVWYNLSLKNGRIDLNARDYKNAFLMYINSILGFIIFSPIPYIISKIKYIRDIFAFFGRISIYILAYHIPSNIVIYGIINGFLPISIINKLTEPNIISLSYFTVTALLFSAIMFLIHKNILENKL